ncbi:MAG TPA: hypothetical protein PK563_14215 [Tenuifilaceae bacterium]|nr:hypothetical protein [Tenuifilaceae bacterium]
MGEKLSSRRLAQDWKYPRYSKFEEQLRVAASNWFEKKGFPVHPKMKYCLDKLANWTTNIILPEVSNYILDVRQQKEKDSRPFPLHKYAHHGLSSQAMVFNLMGPLIVRNDYDPLIEVLENKGISINKKIEAEFEYEDRTVFNEDTGQPTSIDLIIKSKGSEKKPFIFVESKLVEAEFGGCSVFAKGDCNGRSPVNDKPSCFLHFIGRKYWDLMDKHGFAEVLKDQKICILVNYYQFFRELLLSIEKNGTFVLLYDERSPVFVNSDGRGLIPLLREFIPEQHQNKLILITIQELVESISRHQMHSDWIGEFKEKYGIIK